MILLPIKERKMNSRTIALLGEENFTKIQKSRVLIVGLGGVGGYILESLVRSGVGTIGLCDFDIIDISNLNRQILATQKTIGQKKVDAAFDRAKEINPDVHLIKYDFRVSERSIPCLELDNWDFVADAIDDVPAKILLMEASQGKIISSMGTGNKLDPFAYKIARIEKTEVDPLAKSIRRQLKDKGVKNIPVLYSDEKPVSDNIKPIPTISFMPAVAGYEISSYIIKSLLDNRE